MKNIGKLFGCLIFFYLLTNFSYASLFWDINVGIDEFYKGNYVFAKDYFESYLGANPNDKDGYWWLAKTYQKLKDKKSKEIFKKSYELTSKEKPMEKITFDEIDISALEDYFDMAVMYFEAGDYKNAEIYSDLMLKISPKSPSAYFLKSKLAYTKGDNKKAKEYLNKAVLFNSEILNTNLAKNLDISQIPQTSKEMYSTFALEAYFLGDISSVIKNAKKYLEADTNNQRMQNMLIDAYIKNNDIENAKKTIDIALKQNENNIEALLYKAKINKNDEEEILNKAFEINPNKEQTLLALGNFYLKKRDYQKSKKYFEMLTSVDDEFYEGYFGLIYSLIELGQLDEAQDLIRKANSFNSNSSEILYLLGKICEYTGSYKEAFDYYNRASDKEENPNYNMALARTLYTLKSYENSLANIEEAEKMPFSPIDEDELELYKLKNYIKMSKFENAKSILNKQNMLDKNRLIYKYNLYIIYKLEGNKEQASELWKKIKKIKLQTAQDYVDMSEILYEQKGLEVSDKILDEAIKKFPNDYSIKLQKIKLHYIAEQ